MRCWRADGVKAAAPSSAAAADHGAKPHAAAPRWHGACLAVLRACLWLAYPSVYLLSAHIGSPRYLGAALLTLLWLQRWLGAGSVAILLRRLSTLDWCVLLTLTLCSTAIALTNSEALLRFYPSVVNLGLLLSFGLSLRGPQSMIEKFARLRHPQLSAKAVLYTRRVTQVWCGFFVCSIVLSVYSALFFSRTAWAWYNGVVVYGLVGALIVGELGWRQLVAHPHSDTAH
jgi:uncharacterized membrane protein